MLRLITAGLAAVLGILPAAGGAWQSDSALTVRALRFYRADSKQTRVKGLVQIPLSIVSPAGPAGQGSYTVSARVADSTGLTLFHQEWSSHVASGAGAGEGAPAASAVAFSSPGSRYSGPCHGIRKSNARKSCGRSTGS